MLRYPKYINLIKKRFGDESEIIVEELLQRGYWTASNVLLKVHNRLSKSNHIVNFHDLKDKFVCLVNAKYLMQISHNYQDDKPLSQLVTEDMELNVLSKINVNDLVKAQTSNVRKFLDKNIFWTINFDRFHQDMRDKVIVNAFTRKFDENVGMLVDFILQQMYVRTDPWADISNPIPVLVIRDIVRKHKNLNQLNIFFDQYINFIGKSSKDKPINKIPLEHVASIMEKL